MSVRMIGPPLLIFLDGMGSTGRMRVGTHDRRAGRHLPHALRARGPRLRPPRPLPQAHRLGITLIVARHGNPHGTGLGKQHWPVESTNARSTLLPAAHPLGTPHLRPSGSPHSDLLDHTPTRARRIMMNKVLVEPVKLRVQRTPN